MTGKLVFYTFSYPMKEKYFRKKLATELWEEEADSNRGTWTSIFQLLEKLEHGRSVERIQTVGRGYITRKKGGKEPEIYVEE